MRVRGSFQTFFL